jgi:anthranilate/para-aminobenzoate synthase component II
MRSSYIEKYNLICSIVVIFLGELPWNTGIPNDRSVVAATTDYGTNVTAVISKDNFCATQFHPEKSGQKGLNILENFVRSTRC